ncbi:MAG: VIT domain-containing protein, partial [Nannocystaceae bacterium]
KSPEEREPTSLNLAGTFQAEATVRPQTIHRERAPISLTSEDGAALELRSLAVRADLERPLAFTELEMEFANPEGRALDARLSVAIPPGARVTRFAVNRKGHWKDAEVVPRHAAYQNLIKERHDPALVSAQAGEQFRARVYPVEASGNTRIIVSYLHEIGAGAQTYRVPLAGLQTELETMVIRIHGSGLRTVQGAGRVQRQQQDGDLYIHRERNVTPAKDVVVEYADSTPLGLRYDNMVVARFSPVHHDHSAPVKSLTVLFDTSASQALDYPKHIRRLEELLAALKSRVPGDIRLRVVAFDQTARTVYSGKLSKFGAQEVKELRRRRPLGASDLAGALRFVSSRSQKKFERVVLMTDGVLTSGPTQVAALEKEVKKLRRKGVARLDVMVEGGLHDQALLGSLVSGHLDRAGLVIPPGTSPDLAARRILRTVANGIPVKIPGSNWVYPRELSGVQHGDEVVVYAEYEGRDDLRVKLGGSLKQTQRLQLVEAREPLVHAAWVAARIQNIDHDYRDCLTKTSDLCPRFRDRILELSMENRVLNDYTAMVMLADERDYKRFGLQTDAPNKLLSVGGSGLQTASREALGGVLPSAPSEPSPRRSLPVRTHAVSTDFRLQERPWDDVMRAKRAASQALPASSVVVDSDSAKAPTTNKRPSPVT